MWAKVLGLLPRNDVIASAFGLGGRTHGKIIGKRKKELCLKTIVLPKRQAFDLL